MLECQTTRGHVGRPATLDQFAVSPLFVAECLRSFPPVSLYCPVVKIIISAVYFATGPTYPPRNIKLRYFQCSFRTWIFHYKQKKWKMYGLLSHNFWRYARSISTYRSRHLIFLIITLERTSLIVEQSVVQWKNSTTHTHSSFENSKTRRNSHLLHQHSQILNHLIYPKRSGKGSPSVNSKEASPSNDIQHQTGVNWALHLATTKLITCC